MKMSILLMALLISGPALADAFKCRTTAGNVVFSDVPCADKAKLEKAQSSEAVPWERRAQAEDVNSRARIQLGEIESEQAAYHREVSRQQSAVAAADQKQATADQRQAAVDRQQKLDDCAAQARRGWHRTDCH